MKPLTLKAAKIKAGDYCAYQERSQQEVRDKLYTYGLHRDEVEHILSELITEGFVNEERFAKSYAGGKFRIKQWGRIKIVQGLGQHRISGYCIKKGLKEIDETDYQATLKSLMEKKSANLSEKNLFIKNRKIADYVIRKGYEPELVWDMIRATFPS